MYQLHFSIKNVTDNKYVDIESEWIYEISLGNLEKQ